MTHPLVRRWTWHTSSDSTKLGVEFHEDVGDVLALALSNMCVLHALGDNTKAAVARLLNTHVIIRILASKQEDHHLGLDLWVLRDELVEKSLDSHSDIWWPSDDHRVVVTDSTSVAPIGIDECTNEILRNGRVDLVTTHRVEDANTPGMEFVLVRHEELLTIETPAA